MLPLQRCTKKGHAAKWIGTCPLLPRRAAGPVVISCCRSQVKPDHTFCNLKAAWDGGWQIWGLPALTFSKRFTVTFTATQTGGCSQPGELHARRAENRGPAGSPVQQARTSESSPPRGRGTRRASSLWSRSRRSARKARRDGGVSGRGCGGTIWSRAAAASSMSQERAVPASAGLLEELSGWPGELCRRELPSVLPRLLISFAVTRLRGVARRLSRRSSSVSSQPPPARACGPDAPLPRR